MSIKKMVQCHLYIIAFSFIVLAGLSLRISDISRSNFENTAELHVRIGLLDKAMYKLMVMRGDVLFLKTAALSHQEASKEWRDAVNSHNEGIRTIIGQWAKQPKQTARANELSDQSLALFTQVLDNYMGFMANLNGDAAIIDETDDLITQLEALTSEYLQVSDKVMSGFQERAGFLHDALWTTLAFVIALFIIMYISLSRYITRMILNRLAEASAVFSEISQGELGKKVPDYGRNEMCKLFVNIEGMRVALVNMIGSVKSVAVNIRHNAVEISHGNNDLSSRTEEQASALQQTAASMEQIKTTVQNNTAHAREANNLATEAKKRADSGSVIMVDVVNSMGQIATNANQIASIIKVIDGIAGQTNILALNAAVEAARAGEQGRGFAVVASEVRHLAQRSADAAKEIESLIEESVDYVGEGCLLVGDAGDAMDNIVQGITHVTDIMSEIASASDEQSRGINQISQAVSEMDSVTQQNASLVQEASAAAASLEEQAERLTQSVAVFRLDSRAATVSHKPTLVLPDAKPASSASSNNTQNWETF